MGFHPVHLGDRRPISVSTWPCHQPEPCLCVASAAQLPAEDPFGPPSLGGPGPAPARGSKAWGQREAGGPSQLSKNLSTSHTGFMERADHQGDVPPQWTLGDLAFVGGPGPRPWWDPSKGQGLRERGMQGDPPSRDPGRKGQYFILASFLPGPSFQVPALFLFPWSCSH